MTTDVGDLIRVRKQVQADHTDLRALLESLNAAARGVYHGAGLGRHEAAVAALRLAVVTLVARFEQHLEMEEDSLLPILRKQDGWGDVRADEILYDHERQRLVLRAMLEDAPLAQVNFEMVDELGAFVRQLLRDMDLEDLMLATLVHDSVRPSMA